MKNYGVTGALARLTAALCLGFGGVHGALADYTVVQVAPFSGSVADSGEQIRLGINLVFQDANDKGGVNGQKLHLVTKDDGYRVEDTVKLAREAAAQEKPIAFLGFVGTGNVQALLQSRVLDDSGIPLVGARTGAVSLREPFSPQLFHVRASYVEEVDKLVEVAAVMGASRYGVVYQNDPFGQEGVAALKKALVQRKLSLVAEGSYEKNTVNVTAAVEAMLKVKDLSAIILVSNTQATAAFLQGYRGKGGTAQVYGLSVNNDQEVVHLAGAQNARALGIAQVVPFPSSGVLPVTRDYQALLKKYAPKAAPGVSSFEGYLYARVLVEGLKRAGPKADRAALIKALEAGPFELGGFVVRFTPNNHEGSHFVELTILDKSGALIR